MTTPLNILIINGDQLAAQAVGAYGNPHVQTPAIDGLAARGVHLENCYTPCPLCQPARAAFWTGLLPHETGVLSNGLQHHVPQVPASVPTLGSVFGEAGYDCLHIGKTHDAGTLRGFRLLPRAHDDVPQEGPWSTAYNIREDAATVRRAGDYLAQPHDRPFLLVADLHQPHDICEWIGNNAGVHTDDPIPDPLPPLPANFDVADMEDRPAPVQYICCSHRRLAQTAEWNETNWRYYLAAYYHYCNRLDRYVGELLTALQNSEAADNTLVVFMADHGEGMGCHRMVTKQVSFYDETTRVPVVFAGRGVAGGRSIAPPTSLLDLLPTLCGLADVPSPERLRGVNLADALSSDAEAPPRAYVVSQWHTEWGLTIEPGRMLRTPRYKYTRYLEGDGEELFDMVDDPLEQRTLVSSAEHAGALNEHRQLFADYLQQTDDPFLSLQPSVDARWRSHAPGYTHHRGGSAREAFDAQRASQSGQA